MLYRNRFDRLLDGVHRTIGQVYDVMIVPTGRFFGGFYDTIVGPVEKILPSFGIDVPLPANYSMIPDVIKGTLGEVREDSNRVWEYLIR